MALCPGHQKSRRFWRTATLLAPYLLRTLPITHFSCCPFINTGTSAIFHPPYHWLDKCDHPTFSRRTLKDPPLAGPFAQGKCLQGQEEYLPGPHDHPSHSRYLDTKSSHSNVPEPFLDLVPRAIFLRPLCSHALTSGLKCGYFWRCGQNQDRWAGGILIAACEDVCDSGRAKHGERSRNIGGEGVGGTNSKLLPNLPRHCYNRDLIHLL